jgi:membrane protease YdiL (CAAX protease family)
MLVFLIIRGKRLFTDIAIKPAGGEVHPMLMFGVVLGTQGVQLVNSLLGSVMETIARNNGFSFSDTYSTAFEGLLNPFGIIYIVLVGPICEELIFRGACLGTLRRYGDNFAVIVSSLLFGFYHIILYQVPFAVVIGVILGYTAVKFSLKHAIIVHAISNGLALCYLFIEQTDFSPLMFMGIAALVALVILFSEKARVRAMLQDGRSHWPGVFAAGFSSVWLWAYVALALAAGIIMLG